MEKTWSNNWSSSKQPRKQRKYVHNAPCHVRRSLTSSTLAPELREKYKMRSIPVRKGDEVKIMRGKKEGIKGKVSEVDTSLGRVYIDGQTREKLNGNKVPLTFHASKVMIMSLNLDDKRRLRTNKPAEKKAEKPKEAEKKKEEKK